MKKKPGLIHQPSFTISRLRPLLSFRTKCIVILVIILIFFYTVTDSEPKKRLLEFATIGPKPKVNLQYITLHIDLKGAPPKLKYLMTLLPDLKELGVNSLLLEYEDMFPYQGSIVNISTPFCYTKRELKHFLTTAAMLNIEVIPLLQLYGNMQHVLKLEEFKHLRENLMVTRNYCPLQNYLPVVTEMLRQVISLHEEVAPLKHIHIGCKEPNHVVSCDRCRSYFGRNSSTFLSFMKVLGGQLKVLAPNVTILLWDDVFRKVNKYNDLHEVTPLLLGDLFKIEAVVWDHNPVFTNKITDLHRIMLMYHRAFKNIWIAPAFKGVDIQNGREAMVPNLKNRLINTLNWLNFIHNYVFPNENVTFDYKGIILTGWSRNDHFSPLNELLPVSLRTLTCSLRLIERFRHGVSSSQVQYTLNDWDTVYGKYFLNIHYELTKCNSLLSYERRDSPVCRIHTALSHDLYKTMRSYESVLQEAKRILVTDPEHTIKFYYDDVPEMTRYYNKTLLVSKTLNVSEALLKLYLPEFFDQEVIDEYIGFRSYTAKKRAEKYLKVISENFKEKVWERGRMSAWNYVVYNNVDFHLASEWQ